MPSLGYRDMATSKISSSLFRLMSHKIRQSLGLSRRLIGVTSPVTKLWSILVLLEQTKPAGPLTKTFGITLTLLHVRERQDVRPKRQGLRLKHPLPAARSALP